jgi:hypothetical protein
MSQRNKAIQILRSLHDKLADRLSELVVENEEMLLEDACTNMGLCNEIYDLAEKLRAVSMTLGVLPPSESALSQPSQGIVVVAQTPNITLGDFVELINGNQLDQAAGVLSHLFQIPLSQAVKCTDHFVRKLETDSNATNKLLQLTEALYLSRLTEAYDLVQDLFGLLPDEGATVVKHLTGNQ